MRKKNSFQKYFNISLIFLFGFALGVVSIWPGIFFKNSRKCFSKILKDGSDGNIQLKTMLSINPNLLLKINNANNVYFKILLIGDSCFRKF